MAYLPGIAESDIVSFQGSAQAVDPYELDSAHGLLSQNVDFIVAPDGAVQVMGRRGTSLVASSSGPTGGANTALASWYFSNSGSQDCWALELLSGASAAVSAWEQASATLASLFSVSGSPASMSFAPDGIRGYFAFMDSTGRNGVTTGAVFNATMSGADVLFPHAPAGTATTSQGGTNTGSITAGTHGFSLIYTTRNGFVGSNSSTVGTFIPFGLSGDGYVSFADGTRNYTVTITLASIPTYMTPGGTFQGVMTPATNLYEWYTVPGLIVDCPSTPGSVQLVFSISDGQLTATGTNVTEYPNKFQTGISSIFNPSAVFTFSSRMGYITVDASGFPVVYFSDQNAYQSLTPAYHGIYLEGRQIPVQGCSIGSTCYIATLSGLYSCTDNGGYPGTWTPPARVDGSVGILSPTCIVSSGGRILLASEKGLFSYRGGTFPQIPLSYRQAPDWNRINWAAPTQIQVADDGFDRVIRVIAPLTVIITAATNANPIQITTAILINGQAVAYPHNFQTGLSVTIAGVTGNTNANGTFTITVTGANTFTISEAGNGSYAPTGAPYATATPNSPNAEMSWNYSLGEDPTDVLYSLNSFSAFTQGAIGIVRNLTTSVDEPWYLPLSGSLIRRVLPSDTYVHRDVDASGTSEAIASYYEAGLFPGPADQSATLHDFHGAHFRAWGNGSMALTAYGIDHVRSVIPAMSPLTLAALPGQEILVKWFLRSEQESIMFSTNAVDAYFVMALIRAYWTPSLPMR